MPEVTFEKGNLIFQNDGYAMSTSKTIKFLDTRLDPTSNSKLEEVMFQPGKLMGWIMYIGQNSSSQDIDFTIAKRTYDSGTKLLGSFVPKSIPPVIPSGFTGYICMDPALAPEADRSWQARDMIEFSLRRPSTGGTLNDVTFAFMYEITREYILDNDFADREPPGNRPPL